MKRKKEREPTQLCHMCGNMVQISQLKNHQLNKCQLKHLYGTVYATPPEGERNKNHTPWFLHASGPFVRTGPPPLIAQGQDIPDWLEDIVNSGTLPDQIPLDKLLEKSCFYPASGSEPSPILLSAGHIHSFVYADYGVKREDFLHRIHWMPLIENYELILERDVSRDELVPQGWQSPHVNTLERVRKQHNRTHGCAESCKSEYCSSKQSPIWFDRIHTDEHSMHKNYEQYGHWSVWRRKNDVNAFYGPDYFSFFFLALEGSVACDALYSRNSYSPYILAIIQPGHALGDNFDCFFDQKNSCLWRAINRCPVKPKYLIAGHSIGNQYAWRHLAFHTFEDFNLGFQFHEYDKQFFCRTMYLNFYDIAAHFNASLESGVPDSIGGILDLKRALSDLAIDPEIYHNNGLTADEKFMILIERMGSRSYHVFPRILYGWELIVFQEKV
jgi:hypothetical protein